MRDALADYHTMARQTIESFGGSVAKFIGDGVMALWGVPEVAEDDAERAVVCGAALQDEFAAIRDHIGQTHGVEVGLRVGINTGEVVIADGTVTGAGVVLAQRLEQLSDPAGVCISAAVREALPARMPFRYSPLGEQRLKGFDEPIRVFGVARQDGARVAAGCLTIDGSLLPAVI